MSQLAQEQQQLSLLRSLIDDRSFDDATLRILQSLLVSKDVESLMQVRYNLTVFLRYQFLSVIHSIASKTVQEKLFVLDFFVRAFAIVGDVEAQAAKYLTRRSSEQGKSNSIYEEKRCLASTSFRKGIKRQNMRKLQEQRSLLQISDE